MNGENIGQLDLFKEVLDGRQLGPDAYVVPGDASTEYYSGSIEQDKENLEDLLEQRTEYLSLLRTFDDAFIDVEDNETQAIPLGLHNVIINETLEIDPSDKIFCRIKDHQYAEVSDDKRMVLDYSYGSDAITVEYFSATNSKLTATQKIEHDRTNQLFDNNDMEHLGDDRGWFLIRTDVFGSNRFRSTDPKQQSSTEIIGDPNDANAPMQAARYAEFIGNEIDLLKDVCVVIAQGILDYGSQERTNKLDLNDKVRRAWYAENLPNLELPELGMRFINELVRKVVEIAPSEATADIIDLRDGKETSLIYDQTKHKADSDFVDAN